MLQSPPFKRFFIFSIYVSATGLYTLIFIPENIRDMVQMIGIVAVIALVVLDVLYGVKTQVDKNFKTEIYMFLVATFLSMFVAYAYHGQGFTITLVAQRYMYFYLFYFALHILRVEIEDIESMILPLAFVYVILYLVQYFIFPTIILDSRVAEARGTVRIFLPGGGFMVLAYFKALQDLLKTHKLKYALLCALFFIIPAILQGTRQSLASFVLVTAAYILFSKHERTRIVIVFLLVIGAVSLFFLFYDIFLELMAVTQKQADAQTTNIRVVALNFFLNDFMPSIWAYIFGNGQDSMNAAYGLRVSFYRTLGLHQSDLGLIGDYTKFGVLFAIAQLSITLRMIFGKLPREIEYFRYFFISRLMVTFTGGNMFGGANGIAFVVVLLYMYDVYKHKQDQENEETVPADVRQTTSAIH